MIRPATQDDLPVLTGIYNHYIRETSITFDLTPFTVDARQAWFDQFSPDSRHQLLVIEVDNTVAGYASSLPLRPKAAYDTSVETTIYLAPGYGGRGLGMALYSALFERLALQNVHRCYGIVTLPNDPSIRLHERLGFEQVGHLREVGHKFGKYWDTVWLEKPLS